MKYADQLKDPRWQKKRLEILEAASFTCGECGDTRSQLHVHHSFYRKGLMAWQYPDPAYHCLCETCHELRSTSEHHLLMAIHDLDCSEVEDLATAISKYTETGASPLRDFVAAADAHEKAVNEQMIELPAA